MKIMLHQAETSQGHSVSDCVIGVCGGPGESQRDFFTPSMRFPACSAQYRPERAAEATFTNTIDVDVDSLARCVKLSFETSSVASGTEALTRAFRHPHLVFLAVSASLTL